MKHKAFRFTELPQGAYTFVINGPAGEYRETIQNQPSPTANLNVNLVPMAIGQRYQLVVLGEEISELDVTIVDEDEAVLFDESVSLDGGTRAFNLERVQRGEVRFIISDGKRQTVESVSIR